MRLRQRLWQLGALFLALSSSAFAQGEVVDGFFGNGKPPLFGEQEADRRFRRSRIAKLLTEGTEDPDCAQVVGALLTALGEIGPTLHKRDENFTVDPALLQILQRQLNAQGFPGTTYLTLMVRRVLMDGKMPKDWLDTAIRINQAYRVIDISKLKALADDASLVDSYYLTIPALREAHQREIGRATRASDTSQLEFRDKFLDRTVTWTDLMVVDIGPDAPEAPAGKKRRGAPPPVDDGALVATLQEIPPRTAEQQLVFFKPQVKAPEVMVRAKLSPQQFLDLGRIPRNRAVTVRGRLWEMNADLTQLQLRDAQLFYTRDWSEGAVLVTPTAIAQCPAAIDELNGIAPNQAGGFGHH